MSWSNNLKDNRFEVVFFIVAVITVLLTVQASVYADDVIEGVLDRGKGGQTVLKGGTGSGGPDGSYLMWELVLSSDMAHKLHDLSVLKAPVKIKGEIEEKQLYRVLTKGKLVSLEYWPNLERYRQHLHELNLLGIIFDNPSQQFLMKGSSMPLRELCIKALAVLISMKQDAAIPVSVKAMVFQAESDAVITREAGFVREINELHALIWEINRKHQLNLEEVEKIGIPLPSAKTVAQWFKKSRNKQDFLKKVASEWHGDMMDLVLERKENSDIVVKDIELFWNDDDFRKYQKEEK